MREFHTSYSSSSFLVAILAPLPRPSLAALAPRGHARRRRPRTAPAQCRRRRPRAVPSSPSPRRPHAAPAPCHPRHRLPRRFARSGCRRTKLTPPGAPPSQDAPHQPVVVIDWPLKALHHVKPGSSHQRAKFWPPPSTSADGENLPVTLSLFSLYSPTCPSPLPTESQATSPSRAACHGRSPKLFHSSP